MRSQASEPARSNFPRSNDRIQVIEEKAAAQQLVYPKVIGERLQLNPLAVSLSLLFWAWIWGAPGVILAIPILGAGKIICDHIDTLRGLGAWLGHSTDISP